MKVKSYKGIGSARMGIWWMRRWGYEPVGNASVTKKFLRSPLYTVTFRKR